MFLNDFFIEKVTSSWRYLTFFTFFGLDDGTLRQVGGKISFASGLQKKKMSEPIVHRVLIQLTNPHRVWFIPWCEPKPKRVSLLDQNSMIYRS